VALMLVSLVDAVWNLMLRGGRPPPYWHGEDEDAHPYAPPIVRDYRPWPGAEERWPHQPWPYQPWPGSRGDGR
jgi:hypothetical protein